MESPVIMDFQPIQLGYFLLSTHLPPDPNEIILLKELNEIKDTVIPRSLWDASKSVTKIWVLF